MRGARPTLLRRRAGALLALVLLVVRLVAPTHAAPATAAGRYAADLAGLLGDVPICHADPAASPAAPQPADGPAVPAHDCVLCPACQLASAPALLPAAGWVAAAPAAGRATVAPLPPSTGPPRPGRLAARPRGPPLSAV